MASYGLSESGLERLITATYSLLGLMSFLTAGEDEVRAWTIPYRWLSPPSTATI
jgi:ribosome-binding ATPase